MKLETFNARAETVTEKPMCSRADDADSERIEKDIKSD
jgi:hypothetical protein